MGRAVFRRLTAWACAIALGAQAIAYPIAAQQMSRADYEACQAREEAGFRTAIEGITARAMTSGIAKVDIRALVGEEWRRGNLDDIIDKRVDLAVAEVRDETSWGTLLQSLAYKQKAQELATSVTERVYRSDAVKSAFETLAVGVGKQIAQTIELATLDAAEPALQCIQAFLGPRYGTMVARIVTQDAGKQFSPEKAGVTVSGAQLAAEGAGGMTGAVLLIVRRQLANMASRIGQRIVGAVLSRVVSVVAGGVGVVLIAKDIWDFRHGVLPIIATEMKSPETKAKVADEIAATLREQINEHTREISSATADRVVEIWRDFQRAHAKVVDLAERHEPFRKFLDLTRPERLPRLDEVVALILAAEGEPGVLRRLGDGTLHQAVNVLPPAGLEIAREQRSIEQGLSWMALAGDKLPEVLEYEVHRRASPSDFTAQTLRRVLQIGDKVAIARIASLRPDARLALIELEDGDVKTLARSLTEDELGTLARYLTGLDKAASQRVLRAVAQSPAKMQVLASARVRDAILASRDQLAAVGMMLRADPLLEPWALRDDVKLVLDGNVSPILLWDKHPLLVAGALLAGLVFLLMLKRLVFGRRRPIIAS